MKLNQVFGTERKIFNSLSDWKAAVLNQGDKVRKVTMTKKNTYYQAIQSPIASSASLLIGCRAQIMSQLVSYLSSKS